MFLLSLLLPNAEIQTLALQPLVKEEAVSHWENSTNSAEEVAVSLGIPNSKYGLVYIKVRNSP